MRPDQKELLERIAGMKLANYPQNQIAEILGVSEGRITQLMQQEVFQTVYEEVAAGHHKLHEELDEGWDSIEKMSLGVVKDHLSFSKDADFALRAATLANKAARRTPASRGNQPIQSANGLHAVVQLPRVFIQNIQNNKINLQQRADLDKLPKKEHDFLSAEEVHGFLEVEDPNSVQVLRPGVYEEDEPNFLEEEVSLNGLRAILDEEIDRDE